MKMISKLKMLPLAGILALSLGLAPAVSLADDNYGRLYDRVYTTHGSDKGFGEEHRHRHRDGKDKRDHGRHKKHGHKHRGHQRHGDGHHGYSHKHRGHKHHGHTHHRHKHHGHGHRHVDRVIVHKHYDDWDDYDRFRLLLGLHFDNIDLIYRDY